MSKKIAAVIPKKKTHWVGLIIVLVLFLLFLYLLSGGWGKILAMLSG